MQSVDNNAPTNKKGRRDKGDKISSGVAVEHLLPPSLLEMPTQLTSLVPNIHIYTPAEIEHALQQYNSDTQHTQEREEKEHTERENNTERKKRHNTQSGDSLNEEITSYSSSSTAHNNYTSPLNVSSAEERNAFSSFSVLTPPTPLSHTPIPWHSPFSAFALH